MRGFRYCAAAAAAAAMTKQTSTAHTAAAAAAQAWSAAAAAQSDAATTVNCGWAQVRRMETSGCCGEIASCGETAATERDKRRHKKQQTCEKENSVFTSKGSLSTGERSMGSYPR